jgi:hypothetical protein
MGRPVNFFLGGLMCLVKVLSLYLIRAYSILSYFTKLKDAAANMGLIVSSRIPFKKILPFL